MSENADPGQNRGSRERVVAAFFGALFVGIAIAIVLSAWHEWSPGNVLAAIVVGGLGFEALYSAARRRRCLLSRIGPLP